MERDSAQFTKQRSGSTDSSGLGGQNYNIVASWAEWRAVRSPFVPSRKLISG